MKFARPRRAEAEITLTPLVDILFIVLLFLVLGATFTEQTFLRIALPETTTGERRAAGDGTMRILVEADGTLHLDGRVQTLDEIGARFDAIPDKGRASITIAADERAAHGRVVQVVDRIRQAGIFRLGIETFAGEALTVQ